MDLQLETREIDFLNRVQEFSKSRVAPHAQSWEDSRKMPIETLQAAAGTGIVGLEIPEEYGGFGGRFRLKARVAEEIARDCFAFSFSLINNMGLAGKIAREAPKELAERYLPEMLAGEAIGCTALSEPAAGSDFAAISTNARKVDGGWVLNGEKAWITNAAAADLIFLYAQTNPELGWRGVAGFLIDAREEGVERLLPTEMMGGHAIGVGGFKLQDHFIADNRLISSPGDGFKAAMKGVNAARTYVATMCCGMTEAAIELTAEYASNRAAFGTTISAFQGLRWDLADAQTDVEAARLLAYRAVLSVEAETNAEIHAAHAKKFSARIADTHLTKCMQIMGAAGLKRQYPLGRHIACARIANYVDGTTEIQNERIARNLFGS
ncbi:acyl-CoA dehydrogenase family protein [Sneathiella marina]|uniref:Acyl-CoA dehydrogenase family protein n=1 Tax=Sneathiella marina TaxID=2950108 RepID=A0ABY4W7M0_9PROT|nr:acyl-CoA dehydrogenase family protein [Sneathiella marina]USG61922.1 acyl-CoA dehydrogenase family protein [Sneathiella marina]